MSATSRAVASYRPHHRSGCLATTLVGAFTATEILHGRGVPVMTQWLKIYDPMERDARLRSHPTRPGMTRLAESLDLLDTTALLALHEVLWLYYALVADSQRSSS